MDEKYKNLTKSILVNENVVKKNGNIIEYNEDCLAQEFSVIGENQKHGILVFGINPGGDAKDAKFNKEFPTYFYYVNGINNSKVSNSNFHKIIYDVFNDVTDDNVKWDWCNYSESKLAGKIGNGISNEEKCIINEFYDKRKDKKYTIYIGEFFYYHKTSQSDYLELIDSTKNRNEYIEKMLNEHICDIEARGNSIDCIYINNATASHYVCEAINEGKEASYIDYKYKDKTYRIFLGSMLSGQRAMDVFSRQRLISEIKAYLNGQL